MLGHLAHFGKLLVGLCLTQSGGTVAVIAFPVESLLTDRAHQLCPVVALVTRDVLALIAQVDVLVESVAEDDDLITVDEREGSLDVAWFIYEFIALNIPAKHVHTPGKCNAAMIKVLEEHSATRSSGEDEETAVDPRWNGLEKLKTIIKD